MNILDTEKQTFFEDTKGLVEDYIEDRILLMKLQAAEKTAKLASRLYIVFTLGLLLFIVLLIITMLVGYFLAFLTDNFLVGFGIVAIIYIIVIFIVYYMHKRFLGKYVMNSVIKLLFEKKDEANVV